MTISPAGADSGPPGKRGQKATLAALLRLIRPIFRTHWLRLACGVEAFAQTVPAIVPSTAHVLLLDQR